LSFDSFDRNSRVILPQEGTRHSSTPEREALCLIDDVVAPDPDAPVFLGGGARPNKRFRTLCVLVDIGPKANVETVEEQPWVLEDLRKTCATDYDEHVPESSVEILGHSAIWTTSFCDEFLGATTY